MWTQRPRGKPPEVPPVTTLPTPMLIPRPTRCRIHLGNIRHNFRYARALAPGAKAMAVLKANAYGHGAVHVARTLAPEADAFAVARLHEAVELREAGLQTPILLLEGPVSRDEMAEALARSFWMVIAGPEQLAWFLAADHAAPTRVWLKFDSGMHRLGWDAPGLRNVYETLRAHPSVDGLVLMTHFARADEWQDPATQAQIDRFRAATQGLDAPHSLANSAGILAWPQAHGDWIRPGILLYGANPLTPDEHGRVPTHDLHPGMTLESRLIARRTLPADEPIGYGGRFVAKQETLMGVVALGYADGYPRAAEDGAPLVVRVGVDGCPARIIGRVSMDMITVDLSQAPNAQVGSRVELWGEQVDANQVARHCGTIAYELFTRITARCERIYEPADNETPA